jgi:hypothetical protein
MSGNVNATADAAIIAAMTLAVTLGDALVKKGVFTPDDATQWLNDAAQEIESIADEGAMLIANETAAALLRSLAQRRQWSAP